MSGTSENKTVLVDEYNPLRPNDYTEFKEQARDKEDQERKEREREKDRERREKERSEDSRDDRKYIFESIFCYY